MPLHSISIKVTRDACFNSGGRVVVTSGGETGGEGVKLLAASWLPMMVINLFMVSFMAQVASACSLSLFSICWNLSSSMAGESTTFGDCSGGGTGQCTKHFFSNADIPATDSLLLPQNSHVFLAIYHK
jgi:hypothetical protein